MKNEAIVLCKLQVLLNYHTKYFQPSKSSKECNATGPEQVSRICASLRNNLPLRPALNRCQNSKPI